MHPGNKKDGEDNKKDTGSKGDIDSGASKPSHQHLEVRLQTQCKLVGSSNHNVRPNLLPDNPGAETGRIPAPCKSYPEFVGLPRRFSSDGGTERPGLCKHRVLPINRGSGALTDV